MKTRRKRNPADSTKRGDDARKKEIAELKAYVGDLLARVKKLEITLALRFGI